MAAIYLDNNATTRPAPEVVDAMERALRETWANPSSVHRLGQVARRAVELARAEVAALLGTSERTILFTSGGTESDNLALRGALAARGRSVIVTSRLEHSAIRETAERLAGEGTEVVWLDTDARGLVDVAALEALLAARADEIALVSVMWVNNETGVVQPVEAIGAACRARGVRFHTDAVQAVGKMPVEVEAMPIDLLTFSAHKLHGPKGVGGLYVRRGVRLAPTITGGPQERDRRGGTENVPGIVGMGEAARLARAWLASDGPAEGAHRRDAFERALRERVPDVVVNGADAPRLWNATNAGVPRLEAEAMLLLLSERGVCASAGAACSSGSLDPSPVLLAMGVPPEVAHGSVRYSQSRDTTEDDLAAAVDVIGEVIERLRVSSSAV